MVIKATLEHMPFLQQQDRYIQPEELARKVEAGQVYLKLAAETAQPQAWLRWGLFWDNTPFLNLLYVLEPYRGGGLGSALLAAWQADMTAAGHRLLMTSTQSDEDAFLFFEKHGYARVGGFAYPGQAREWIYTKQLPL